VEFLLDSRLPVIERIGSAGLPAGCREDLPVLAALHTNRKNTLDLHTAIISRPLASRPISANPASVNATTITVIASTAG